MFGGNKPGFGQASTGAGFGFTNTATSSPFGATSFGKTPTPGFGQANTFGQQNTSLFGNAASSTGLFGSANTSGFGGATGTQTTFGGFSQPTQGASLFGSTAQNANQSSLFGQTAAPTFGASKPSGFGFGQTQPTTSLFGQATTASTSGTGFGAFGQNSNTSLFGSPNMSFGQNATAGSVGTAIVKYQPLIGTDTLMKNGQPSNINTRQHCITAMKEYENKSLEELRMEDYLANRKGPQTGTVAPFGQVQPGTGPNLFGSTSTQPATGIFGQQPENKSLFGTTNTLGGGGFGTGTSAFGATSQATTPYFNKPFSAPSTSGTGFAFGNTSNTTNPFGAKTFGQTGSAGIFGSTSQPSTTAFGQNQTGFSGFGNATQQPSIFGNTGTDNKATFGLGSTANTGFSGFGTNTNTSASSGGLFGAKPVSGFGATPGFGVTTSTSSGFGSFAGGTAPGSLFNNTLNKPATSGFAGFGTQASAAPLGGALNFGNSSLFGGNAPKPGLFGGTNQTAPSLFGNSSTFMGSNTFGGFGTSTLGSSTIGSTQQPVTLPIHQQIMALTTSPYGENPLFKNLKLNKGDETDASKATNPIAQQSILDLGTAKYKIAQKAFSPLIKVRPSANASVKQRSLFDGLEEYDASIENSFGLKPNVKRLILKNKASKHSPNTSLNSSISTNEFKENSFTNEHGDKNRNRIISSNMLKESNAKNEVPSSYNKPDEVDTTRRESWLHPLALERIRNKEFADNSVVDNTLAELIPRKSGEEGDQPKASSSATSAVDCQNSTDKSGEEELEDSQNSSLSANNSDEDSVPLANKSFEPNASGVILSRMGYYTIPALDELPAYLSDDGTTCLVPNFTIGREGYGNVYFSKPIDVFGLNLDQLVHFRHKEIIIYPNDENKPPVGSGLNTDAQVTLDQVWPHDKSLHEPIKDPERLIAMGYEAKLRRACDKHDIRFIEYRPETGSWVFKVKHFSKYGLSDSDEDEDSPTDPKKQKLGPQAQGAIPKKIDKANKVRISEEIGAQKNDPEKSTYVEKQLSDVSYFNENRKDNSEFKSHTDSIYPLSPTGLMPSYYGVNKVQLMKATFFGDDDSDVVSVFSENFRGRESPDQIVPTRQSVKSGFSSRAQSLSSESIFGVDIMNQDSRPLLSVITESEKPILFHPVAKPAPLRIAPTFAKIRLHNMCIPFEKSIGYILKGKCLADMALYNCRYFKLKFGASNMLFKPNYPSRQEEVVQHNFLFQNLARRHSFTAVMRYRIEPDIKPEDFNESIVNHLKIQLTHSLKQEIEESDCPFIQSGGKTDLLLGHLEEAKRIEDKGDFEKYIASVWSLCQSLWGSCEELDGHEPSSHFSTMCRKSQFSEWIESTLLDADCSKDNNQKNGHLDQIFQLLLCHKVKDACELAFKYDDINLSLLLSQLSGGPAVRQLISHQLSIWQKTGADKYIQPERLKLFMIIAGTPVISSSHGPINALEGVHWLKVLAMQLWYLCSATASITDAVIAYDKAFGSPKLYASPPTPDFNQNYQLTNGNSVYDVRYHILQLFSRKSHSMESLLNPTSYTSDVMDYRLSWLLLQTLSSLGYQHCTSFAEAQIHVCFANQLELYGLWQWAIFVLLHIKDKSKRELSVQEVLYRHVAVNASNSEEETFVVDSLGVPQKWIDWAKAVKAGVERNYDLQAKFLLRAKQWSLAHQVIMDHLAPDAIINENTVYLKELLSQFEDDKSKKVMRVQNWPNQGQIYLDYIEIKEKFNHLKGLQGIHLNDIETRWENLKCQLSELCSRINLLPCPTAKHRLCQSEIAQQLACLLRGLIVACQMPNPCTIIKVAMEKLPLPQEFVQQEMRVLFDYVVSERYSSPEQIVAVN